jgi:hypothetical protein
VEAFLQTIKEEEKRKDCMTILTMMKEITGKINNKNNQS